MLSIVVCSTKPQLLRAFEKNVAATIGVPYELIAVDNSANKYSIFQAYNIGLDKAQYPLVAFIHEDVAFLKNDWGKYVVQLFSKNEKLGLLGICGAGYKTKAPSNWWANPSEDFNYQYIFHQKEGKYIANIWGWGNEPPAITEKKVVAIDGVLMVLRKAVNVRFNEQLQGFHNYDISLSVDVVKAGYEVWATRQIELVHFSEGKLNDDWLRQTALFYKIYKDKLPVRLDEIPANAFLEKNNYIQFINRAFLSGNKAIGIYFWKEMFKYYPFTKNHLLAFKYYFKCRRQ